MLKDAEIRPVEGGYEISFIHGRTVDFKICVESVSMVIDEVDKQE